VKYEQLLKRSGSRTRRFPGRVRVSAPGHVTSGRREQSATQDAQESQNPQSGTAAENTLSRNHVVPKYRIFLRNARRRVKYLGETKRAVLHSELFQQFITSKFIPAFFFTFTLFTDFRSIIDLTQFSPISNYPSPISESPIHDPNLNPKKENSSIEWSRSPYRKVCRRQLSKLD